MTARRPLHGHAFHQKSDEALRFIIKDAGEAAFAMRGHSPAAEGKYLDQVNDACTVLRYRANMQQSRFVKNAFLDLINGKED